MKNKLLGVIAIALITLSLTGCGGGDDTPETFTVTFNANGGSPTPTQQIVEKGKTADEPAAMTKDKNDFDDWYKESGFITKWNFSTDTVTANITLHAKWIPYYGKLPNGVKIYKGDASITDAQMASAVLNVIAGYNGLSATDMATIQGKFTKVIIISDKNYSWDGSVLGIKYDRSSAAITGRFELVASGEMPTD
jgi:hypothetical protein